MLSHMQSHTFCTAQALVAEQEEELLEVREQCAGLVAANQALHEELEDLRARCVTPACTCAKLVVGIGCFVVLPCAVESQCVRAGMQQQRMKFGRS